MPRSYIRKRTRGNVNPVTMLVAVRHLKNTGESVRKTAKSFGINYRTLSRYVKRFSEDSSRSNIFLTTSKDLEKISCGSAVPNKTEIPKSWFDGQQTGSNWLASTFKLLVQLSLFTPNSASITRASSFNKVNVKAFIEILKRVSKRHNVLATESWNLVETGVTTSHRLNRFIARRETKQTGSMTPEERDTLLTVEGNHIRWLLPNHFTSHTCKMQKNDMIATAYSNGVPTTGGSYVHPDTNNLSVHNNFSPELCDDGLILHIDDKMPRYDEKHFPLDSNILLSFGNNFSPELQRESFSPNQTHKRLDFSAIPSPVTHPSQLPFTTATVDPSSFTNRSPDLSRQTSFSIAMEVLGSLSVMNHSVGDLYPPTPQSDYQDELCQQHPSPSFYHILPEQTRNRVCSENHTDLYTNECNGDIRQRFFSADNTFSRNTAEQFLISYNNDTTSNDENKNSASASTSANDDRSTQSSTSTTTCTSINNVETSTSENVLATADTPALTSLPSFIVKMISNPPADNIACDESLDMDGMLDDFLRNTASSQEKQEGETEVVKSLELVEIDHTYSLKRRIDHTDSSFSKTIIETIPVVDATSVETVDLTESEKSSSSSTPKMKRTPSYIKRRNQNNKACRESRRKRKAELDDAEMKLVFFTKDNEVKRNKIKQLELEVKETRALLLSRMAK